MQQFTKTTLLSLILSCYVGLAHGDIQWDAPVTLQSDSWLYPSISVNHKDHAMVMWVDSTNRVVSKVFENVWQDTIPCSAPATLYFENPMVAFNSSGDAIAMWRRAALNRSAMRVANYKAGAWSASQPIMVLPNVGYLMSQMQIAFSDAGEGVASWVSNVGFGTYLNATIFKDGNWSDAEMVSGLNNNAVLWPDLAINDLGDMLFVWVGAGMVQSAYHAHGTDYFSEPMRVSTEGIHQLPKVSINNNGDAIAVWQVDDQDHPTLMTARFSAGQWSAPTSVQGTSADAREPFVKLNNQGVALFGWKENGQFCSVVENNGNWSNVTKIAHPGWNIQSDRLQVSWNDVCQAVITYNASEVTDSRLIFPAPPTTGFIVSFSQNQWSRPEKIFDQVVGSSLTAQGRVFVIGNDDTDLKVKQGNL